MVILLGNLQRTMDIMLHFKVLQSYCTHTIEPQKVYSRELNLAGCLGDVLDDIPCKNRFPSENYPSSEGSESDRLVHWCHGAPRVAIALAKAAQNWAGFWRQGVPASCNGCCRCGMESRTT